MTRLSYLERRLLRYHGMPASNVAIAEHMTVAEVLEVRAQLRERGITQPQAAGEPVGAQLSLDDVDHLMRANRAPGHLANGGHA